jgi:hypothetical protein
MVTLMLALAAALNWYLAWEYDNHYELNTLAAIGFTMAVLMRLFRIGSRPSAPRRRWSR